MRYQLKSALLLLFCISALSGHGLAQDPPPDPREEELLNGLKVLIWKQPRTNRVSVSLRVHSGAAFDPQDKEGSMALLGDIFFPEEAIRTFFAEDLNGRLDVTVRHDYIQIDADADAEHFLTVMETLSTAVSKPPIDKETFEKVQARRLARLAELESDPGYVADRAVADRLFGDFPYGRPVEGTGESIKRIDFADLIFNRDRFLTADNATLTIAGDVRPSYAYKAARRLFGGWQKSLRKVPANFRLPEEPDRNLRIIPVAAERVSELRFAAPAMARGDETYHAGLILASILDARSGNRDDFSVEVREHLLPGYVVYGFSDWNVSIVRMTGNLVPLPGDIGEEIARLFEKEITAAEFEEARKKVLEKRASRPFTERWLDAHTYRLGSVKDDLREFTEVTLADVRKLAAEWKKEEPVKVLVVTRVEEPEAVRKDDPADP